ncbi:hypothetical protein, partial [Paraburkholderia heleia]|uniref:hypothetical protein n=1 Tax=Paraburkholderia heleia TaxID=634127 RepID=UPI0031DE32E0
PSAPHQNLQDSHVNVPGSRKSHNTISASKLRCTGLAELFRLDSLPDEFKSDEFIKQWNPTNSYIDMWSKPHTK